MGPPASGTGRAGLAPVSPPRPSPPPPPLLLNQRPAGLFLHLVCPMERTWEPSGSGGPSLGLDSDPSGVGSEQDRQKMWLQMRDKSDSYVTAHTEEPCFWSRREMEPGSPGVPPQRLSPVTDRGALFITRTLISHPIQNNLIFPDTSQPGPPGVGTLLWRDWSWPVFSMLPLPCCASAPAGLHLASTGFLRAGAERGGRGTGEDLPGLVPSGGGESFPSRDTWEGFLETPPGSSPAGPACQAPQPLAFCCPHPPTDSRRSHLTLSWLSGQRPFQDNFLLERRTHIRPGEAHVFAPHSW